MATQNAKHEKNIGESHYKQSNKMRVMLTPWEADFQRLPTSILFGDLKICFAVFLGLKLFIASVFVVK